MTTNNTLINENRFFEKVAPFMFNEGDMLPEIIENSLRAKASKVTINTDKENLVVINNGNVLENFSNLFIVAQSNYDEGVEESQKPAGMGVLSIISNSKQVTFESGNKSIRIECEKYFNDANYRSTLLDSIQTVENVVEGMKITATLKNPIDKNITYKLNEEFKYYNIEILFNEQTIKSKTQIESLFQKEISDGVIAMIPVSALGNRWGNCFDGYVLWHGKLINTPQIKPFTLVVNGITDLVTPTLPDRKNITLNEISGKNLAIKLEELLKVEIEAFIENTDKFSDIQKVLPYLNNSYNLDNLKDYYDCSLADVDEKYFDNGEEMEVLFNGQPNADIYFDLVNECDKSSNLKFIYLNIGKSLAPKWVLERLQDKCTFEISTSEKSEYANSFYEYRDSFKIVDSIKLNGQIITAVCCSDENTIYFTKEFDYSEFCGNKREAYCWDHQSYEEAENEMCSDFEVILATYNGSLSIDLDYKLEHAVKDTVHQKDIQREDISKIEIIKDENGQWKLSLLVGDENISTFEVNNMFCLPIKR